MTTITIPNLFDEFEDIDIGLTPAQRFAKFHSANPHVYEALKKLALDLVERGHERIGIGMLFEVLRWQHAMRTTDPDFKLNNIYRSRYARLLMDQEPRLAGVFETRRLQSVD
jgi:hypothetical protein